MGNVQPPHDFPGAARFTYSVTLPGHLRLGNHFAVRPPWAWERAAIPKDRVRMRGNWAASVRVTSRARPSELPRFSVERAGEWISKVFEFVTWVQGGWGPAQVL